MPVITALWARLAAASSAITWRTKRRRSRRRRLQAKQRRRRSPDAINPRLRLIVDRALGLRIERPPWPTRSVEPVDHPEPQPLHARPGDHRAVVGAKLGRRRDEGQAGLGA